MHTDAQSPTTQFGRLLLALIVLASALAALANPAPAHTPHDAISDIVPSPTFAEDGKLYVVSSSRLMMLDNGRWVPLQRGLPRAPEEGQGVAHLAIAPSAPDTMYVTSRIGGIFRSRDAGASWEHAATGLERPDMSSIAVSPRDPNVVLAGGTLTGFARSVDGADTWTPIPGFGRVPALAFAASGRAFAGGGDGRLSISDDNGATWKEVVRSDDRGGITAVVVDDETDTVLVGTGSGGLLRSRDDGETFTEVATNLPDDSVASLAFSPSYAEDQTLWISLYHEGVYRSRDGGERWEKTSDGLTTDPQADQVNVSQFRRVVAVVEDQGETVLFVGGFDGLFRSDNEGDRWVSIETLADYVVGLAISPNFEQDGTIAVATYVKGAYISTDRGDTWRYTYDGLGQELAEGNEFAPIRRLHNISFSPQYAEDNTLFSAGWTAFLRSTDGGETWESIRVAPATGQTLLRQFVLGISPAYRTDHTLYLGTRQGDIFQSSARGDDGSWTQIANVGARVRSFAFDPSFATTQVMFAGTVEGVRKSNDGGRTWRAVTTGPAGETQLALSPGYESDRTIFAGTEGGLFVSRDEGETWQPVRTSAFPTDAAIEAVALSPEFERDRTLFVSVSGTGLFRSTDGGSSFSPVAPDLLAANRIIGDFTNPTGTPLQFSPAYARDRTLFAYAQQDVLRSTDGGDSWTALPLPSALDFLREYDPGSVDRYQPGAESSDSSNAVLVVAAIVAVALAAIGATVFFVVRRSGRRGGDRRPVTEPEGGGRGTVQTDASL